MVQNWKLIGEACLLWPVESMAHFPFLPTSWYLRHLLARNPDIVTGNEVIVLRAKEKNQ